MRIQKVILVFKNKKERRKTQLDASQVESTKNFLRAVGMSGPE